MKARKFDRHVRLLKLAARALDMIAESRSPKDRGRRIARHLNIVLAIDRFEYFSCRPSVERRVA